MGCDIHLWIEGKDKKGKWFVANPRFVDYSNPTKVRDVEEYNLGRSYTLFSALANVRNYNDIPFIQENRGLPNDVTSEVLYNSHEWRPDGHSFGFVTTKELQEYFYKYQDSKIEALKTAAAEIRQLYFQCLGLGFDIINDAYEYLDVDDMRLVFWFDN